MKHIKRLFILLLVAVFAAAGIFSFYKIETLAYPDSYSVYVNKYCEEYGVDKDFIYAVIKCESSFNPNAVSNVGAIGLMQLTPETFDWVQSKMDDGKIYTSDDLYNPEVNVKYGVYLLRLHLKEFNDQTAAIAAYHAGRGSVNKWLKDDRYSDDGKTLKTTPYKETNAYIDRVLKVEKRYNWLHSDKAVKWLKNKNLL